MSKTLHSHIQTIDFAITLIDLEAKAPTDLVLEHEVVRKKRRELGGWTVTFEQKTKDTSEGQRGRKLTPTLQKMLKELRNKEGKWRRAIGLSVR